MVLMIDCKRYRRPRANERALYLVQVAGAGGEVGAGGVGAPLSQRFLSSGPWNKWRGPARLRVGRRPFMPRKPLYKNRRDISYGQSPGM